MVTDMFDTGDIVKTFDLHPDHEEMVGVIIARVTTSCWAVFWSDGDTTYSESKETMRHHHIAPEQWTPVMICKYLEILDDYEENNHAT